MALFKEITLDNGIIVTYHRINTITKITNQSTLIEISSYLSQAEREKEKEKITQGQEAGIAVPMNIFIDTNFVAKKYNENENIEDIYVYLQTEVDKYKDARDI